MSREAFEKLLEHLPEMDKQRIMRVAGEYGIRFDDPAWVGLAVTEHGLITLQRTLAEMQKLEQGIAEGLQQAEQQYRESLKTAATETLVEVRLTLDREAQALRLKIGEQLTQAVATVANEVATQTAHKERTRWLAAALVVALCVVASAVGIGWWTGQAHVAQAVAETRAELPALAAWAAVFDTPEKRQRALWAISEEGIQVYRLAQLNHGFSRLLSCQFGNDIGYTKREGDYTVCYPSSQKTGAVAGFAVSKR